MVNFRKNKSLYCIRLQKSFINDQEFIFLCFHKEMEFLRWFWIFGYKLIKNIQKVKGILRKCSKSEYWIFWKKHRASKTLFQNLPHSRPCGLNNSGKLLSPTSSTLVRRRQMDRMASYTLPMTFFWPFFLEAFLF